MSMHIQQSWGVLDWLAQPGLGVLLGQQWLIHCTLCSNYWVILVFNFNECLEGIHRFVICLT